MWQAHKPCMPHQRFCGGAVCGAPPPLSLLLSMWTVMVVLVVVVILVMVVVNVVIGWCVAVMAVDIVGGERER